MGREGESSRRFVKNVRRQSAPRSNFLHCRCVSVCVVLIAVAATQVSVVSSFARFQILSVWIAVNVITSKNVDISVLLLAQT